MQKEKFCWMNAVIWQVYDRICKIERVTPKQIQAKVNGSSCQSINTENTATLFTFKSMTQIVIQKKITLQKIIQIPKWQGMWPRIQTPTNMKDSNMNYFIFIVPCIIIFY